MASDTPKKMTPVVRAAFEVYRDLGPNRRLKDAAKLMGKSASLLEGYSSKHDWTRLVTEHDHRELKESLGARVLVRERATQKMIDGMDKAADVLLEIALDRSVVPVLDRQGEHMRGPAGDDGSPGELLYRPVVRASTRANCAEKILGLGGLVPVKRTIIEDRPTEDIDEAAAVMESMHPDDLAEFREIVKRRNRQLDGEEE
jgi:hypothetical protein